MDRSQSGDGDTDMANPELEDVLAAAARLQRILPDERNIRAKGQLSQCTWQ